MQVWGIQVQQTLKALSYSMESRSPSNGIRSRMYSSMLMKEPRTPCSFSRCSHSMLRRGTNKMWKSRDEWTLSSLKGVQCRTRLLKTEHLHKGMSKILLLGRVKQTWTRSQRWCPWAPVWDEQRRWCSWRQLRGACHSWGWTSFPLHVPQKITQQS